jgi:hypothetical protein
MSSKTLSFSSFCFLIFISACASTSSKSSQNLNEVKQEEFILQEKSEQSTEGASAEPPAQVTIESVPEVQTPVQSVSVWMEGIGADAFLALGFLQELEKKFKVQSIHGVGFSCWVAVSWASENRGNYAEWQSFKWDSWNLLGTNIFNRVMGRSNLSGFKSRLENKLPLKNKDKFKISENCPYFRQGSYAFEDSRDLSLAEEIWIQMRNPFYFSKEDFEKDDRQSGLMRPAVTPHELLRFTPSSVRYEDHLWIILTNEVVRQELGRVPQFEIQRGMIDGLRWIRKSLASGQITLKDVKDLKKKRSMLLLGRKEGRVFFENHLVKQFVGMESER